MSAPEPAGDSDQSEVFCQRCNRLVVADQAMDCPRCGAPLGSGDAEVLDPDAPPRAPWHFKLLLVGTVGYLIYRLIWFIGWLTHHA